MFKRYYTFFNLESNETKGKFYGKFPKQAALKAFNRFAGNSDQFKFAIVNCFTGKKYFYFGQKIKLSKPMFVYLFTKPFHKQIYFHYKNQLKRIYK